MKITAPLGNSSIEISDGCVFSLIIENKKLFRRYIGDIYAQISGNDGETVLSYNGKPVSFAKNCEIIDSFPVFNINTGKMTSALTTYMERVAVNAENYMRTSELLSKIENYIDELSINFPLRVECGKLDAVSLIKALQLAVADDSECLVESVINYMAYVLEFEPKKLFLMLNMHSFFSEDEISEFVLSSQQKQMCVMMIDSTGHKKYPGMHQLIIDDDLCEI